MAAPLAILDRIALLAVITDGSGDVTYVNGATQIAGAPTVGEKFSPILRPACMRIVKSISGATDRFTTAIRVNNVTRIVEWTLSPLSVNEILYTGQDVTRDRRSLSALREMARSAADASQSKMRFLATMSHEMRTPLNGILGMTGLMLDTPLDANQRTYAEAVRESGQTLLALINDILDFSKIEAGKIDLEEQLIDIRALAQSVTELLSPRAAQKGVEIVSFIASDVALNVVGDEGRLRQILLNLAGNGVKFTETGGVSISITPATDAQARPGRTRLKFEVRDTGIGITTNDMERIFEEFSQADDTRSTGHEGTGLGLSIAKKLVGAMNGDLTVTSDVGKGSLFSFSIDFGVHETTAPTTESSQYPNTVIIASDHTFLSDMLRLQVECLGVPNILHAQDASEAKSLLKSNPDASLLCDTQIAAIGEKDLATASPNALVLISPMARGKLEYFKRMGFDGYLIKPIRQSSLGERLRSDKKPTDRLDTRIDVKATNEQKKYRVLLAEDNQINAVLATAILKRGGHHIDVATNGQEAIDAIHLAHYDIVLMDMRMPHLDGLEATRGLRAAGHTQIPVIALTANAMSTDREECTAAGMDDFLTKPFDPDELLSVIDKWVRKRSDNATTNQNANPA